MDYIIFWYIIGFVAINLAWAGILCFANPRLSFGKYFLVSLFFTPMLSALLAIVETIVGQKKIEKPTMEDAAEEQIPKVLECKENLDVNKQNKRDITSIKDEQISNTATKIALGILGIIVLIVVLFI